MKYLDGFREPDAAAQITRTIADLGERLGDRTVQLMEVCGSHTMAIARYAIRDALPQNVRLVSGPGCPVCVTDPGYVDAALELAERGVHIATFGDMMRVPGSRSNLDRARAEGAEVRVCYSPSQAMQWAQADPHQPWVFLAVGFETTAAPIAAMVQQILRQDITNLSLLTAIKRIPPALDALISDPKVALHGLLCPAHVSAIIGEQAYAPYAEEHNIPCVVAGFEPLDILLGVQGLLEQLVQGQARVDNQYSRVVRAEGNLRAQDMIYEAFHTGPATWRGLGSIQRSGLGLRKWAVDARHKHDLLVEPGRTNPSCRCGDVLKGALRPQQCSLFKRGCHPDRPIGPCMVSSEGSCSAAFKYEVHS